jgi:hypothetical protein
MNPHTQVFVTPRQMQTVSWSAAIYRRFFPFARRKKSGDRSPHSKMLQKDNIVLPVENSREAKSLQPRDLPAWHRLCIPKGSQSLIDGPGRVAGPNSFTLRGPTP